MHTIYSTLLRFHTVFIPINKIKTSADLGFERFFGSWHKICFTDNQFIL